MSEDQLRKFKVLSIAGVVFILLGIGVYYMFFKEEKKEITEIEIPEAKLTKEYNSKLDAVNRQNQNLTYEDDINKYFENANITSEVSVPSVDLFGNNKQTIYDNEEAKMDSLKKVFEKQNQQGKVNNIPKYNISPATQQQVSSTTSSYDNKTNTYTQQPVVNSPTTSAPKEKELTPQEKRELAREARRKELAGGSKGQQNSNLPKSFGAMIRGTQSLKTGQLLTMISTNEFIVNGTTIPKGTNLYGAVQFSNNKADVTIQSINLKGQVIPCNLIVYSSNGTKGIDIDIDTNINQGKNNAISQGASEIGGAGYGRAVGILTDVVKGKAQELKVTFTDNQKILIINER